MEGDGGGDDALGEDWAAVLNFLTDVADVGLWNDFLRVFLSKKGIALSVDLDPSIVTELSACKTRGEVVSLIALDVGVSQESGRLQAQAIWEEDMEAARRAWKIEYIVSDKVLDLVAQQLRNNAQVWNNLDWYVPVVALVQSSGWGKSRLMCQLWRRGFFVVYLSCMKETQSGFPRRTKKLADILADTESTESDIVSLVISILAVLNDYAAGGTTPQDWIQAQEDESDTIQQKIYAKYRMVQPRVKAGAPQVTVTNDGLALVKYYQASETYYEQLYQQEISKLKKVDASVILCIDEAREISGNFAKFRRSLRSIPRGKSFFSVVLGTDWKVADLAASVDDDPSARVRGASIKLYDPIYLIGTSDIFIARDAGSNSSNSSKDVGNSSSSSSTFSTDISNVVRYGRPLWAAYYDSVSDWDKVTAVILLAKKKLLARNVDINEGKEWVTRDLAVAVFACIVGLDVVAWGTLPQRLVARHMRTIVKISKDGKRVYTASAAEPILAAAAAALLHAQNDKLVGEFLEKLIEVCLDGLVLEGVRGEIVARIVIMLAMHKCTEDHDYIQPVSLDTFLETMFGQEIVQQLEENCVNMNGTVFFNSFVPVSSPPSPELLDNCYSRCTAVICRRDESVMDFALPARDNNQRRIGPDNEGANRMITRSNKRVKTAAAPLHHRISFPVQVKNLRGKQSMDKATELLQADERLDSRVELLFQVGWRTEPQVEVKEHSVVVYGLDGFQHLKEMAGVRDKLKRLASACEDIFKDVTDKEMDVLKEMIPLAFN